MKKRPGKNIDEHPDDWEPPWMNPENDRKMPYSEKELEQFAEGFISRMSDIEEVKSIIAQKGDMIKMRLKDLLFSITLSAMPAAHSSDMIHGISTLHYTGYAPYLHILTSIRR